MLMDATSLSAWTKVPPTCGKYSAAYSAISLAGVMGYRKKRGTRRVPRL
jgi:hypothetical protein